MSITIDIDSGSTFTDCFITLEGRYLKVKVPTTPHDLAICFFDALKEAAKVCGFNNVKEFLRHVSIIRYVTTHGTNTFIMRTGDTVGLLVTRGYEENLYAEKGEGHPAFSFVSRDMVIGLDEEVNDKGEIVKAVNEEEVVNAIKTLLERGANILVVSFRNAHLNPFNERKVKEVLNKYFPPHYLGYVPVILASELCKRPDEVTRTNLAILNAYIHRLMAGFLYRVEDELRNLGYRRPLMTVHVNGGVVSISKTRPIDTVGSSPVAGMYGSLFWSKLYGLKDVVTIEIGGTSFDVGLIVDGSLYGRERKLFGLPVKMPIVEVESIGLAGTSIVRVDGDDIRIGPHSAGTLPGPACYDAGGLEPTVLDADVVAGRVNPDYFLGGKIKLNAKRAEEAIERIASTLGCSIEEASRKVLDKFAEQGASFIKSRIGLTGKSPADFVAFIYGGTGPAHCLEILERLGISKAYVFPFSAVFGAFGSSLMNVLHYYEEYKALPLVAESNLALSLDEFNKVVEKMIEAAYRDLEGEGFKGEDALLKLELEVREGEEVTTVESPHLILKGRSEAESIRRAYEEKVRRQAINAVIEILRLRAEVPLPHFTPLQYELGLPSESKRALKGTRTVLWLDGRALTEIYEFEKLKPGSVVEGPAILEGVDTTYVIPKGWIFKIDAYGNGVMERV
jgi:N-methylhydantoinase A/oxoprolinase/acetone carboxylase beta subunit